MSQKFLVSCLFILLSSGYLGTKGIGRCVLMLQPADIQHGKREVVQGRLDPYLKQKSQHNLISILHKASFC